MRVIITGANGFIGSTLVKKFYDNGYKVVSLVKSKEEDISSICNFSDVVYSELSEKEYIINTLKSDEESVFYHLAWAGVNGKQKSDYATQIQNIQMACDCVEIAKEIGCKRFLCSGTIAERAIESFSDLKNSNKGLMYAVAKNSTRMFAELLCKAISIEFVWMQFSNVYGSNNKTGNLISYTLSQLEKQEEATFGPAQQPYDFIYVDDLIEAVYRLGIKESLNNNFYFIGSGKSDILKNYLITVGELAGKRQLVKIGVRPDDGIRYNFEMFDNSDLVNEIGEYVKKPFNRYVKDNMLGGGYLALSHLYCEVAA